MIERPEYVSKLIAYKDTDFIKVITGVRRCGKSTLLKLFANHLTRHGVGQDRIITINYESLLSSDLRDPKLLHEYVGEKVEAANGEPLYVFIDEAQEIEQWAYVMNSLKATFPVDLYVTGSNSKLFAGEDLTYITGRYIELRMYPLSFKEFVAFRGLRSDDECSSQNTPPVSYEKALNDYLSQGTRSGDNTRLDRFHCNARRGAKREDRQRRLFSKGCAVCLRCRWFRNIGKQDRKHLEVRRLFRHGKYGGSLFEPAVRCLRFVQMPTI